MTLQTPTIAEVRASSEVLSAPGASATVVKVGEHFAVKFGHTFTLQEAENLRFMSANSKVPVPKFYKTMVEPETGINFIVMEYINSKTLAEQWPSLEASEKLEIADQLRVILQDLRSLEPPSYLGSLNRKPLQDGIFLTSEQNAATSGPFDTEDDLNEGILKRLSENESQEHVAFLRKLMIEILHDHQVRFTHGDLQAKNILVKKIELGESKRFEIKLIDWKISGWYPEYWEFCNSTIASRFRSEWLEMAQNIMQVYVPEYLMLQIIRSHLLH